MSFLDLVHLDGWVDKLVDEYDETLNVQPYEEDAFPWLEDSFFLVELQPRAFIFDLRVVSRVLHLPLQLLFKPRMTYALANEVCFFHTSTLVKDRARDMVNIASLLRLRADATCPCRIWKPGDMTVVQSMTPLELASAFVDPQPQFYVDEEDILEIIHVLEASVASPHPATCFRSGPTSHTRNLGPMVEVEGKCNIDVGQSQVTDRQEQGQSIEVGHLDHGVEDKQQLEESYHAALSQSVEDANQYEQSCVVEAIMRSKVDAPVSNDGVVVMTLNKIVDYTQVRKALTTSVHLQRAINDVLEAGCEVAPSWTPALLLVPLTQPQLEELGMALRAHHIVGRQSDKDLVVETLRGLRSKKRPSVKAPPELSDVPHGEERESIQTPEDFLVDVVVENTFLKYIIPKDISETSVFAESAPCGASNAKQPAKLCSANPRRWNASPNGSD